jgi:hypothetical protein
MSCRQFGCVEFTPLIRSVGSILGAGRGSESGIKGDHRERHAAGRHRARARVKLRDPKLVAEARAMAAEQGRIAMAALGELAPSVYRESLAALIDEQFHREVGTPAPLGRRRREQLWGVRHDCPFTCRNDRFYSITAGASH